MYTHVNTQRRVKAANVDNMDCVVVLLSLVTPGAFGVLHPVHDGHTHRIILVHTSSVGWCFMGAVSLVIGRLFGFYEHDVFAVALTRCAHI